MFKSFISNYAATDVAKGAWFYALASVFYVAYSSVLMDTTLSKHPMAVWCNFIASFFFFFGAIIWISIGHPDAYNKPGIMFYDKQDGDPTSSFWVYHFGTANLRACWMYVFGCVPFIVYSIYELMKDSASTFNWLSLLGATVFTYMTWYMVLASYPDALNTGTSTVKRLLEDKHSTIRRLLLSCFEEEYLLMHLGSDWLISAWIWFWVNAGTLAVTLPYLFTHFSSTSTHLLVWTLLFYAIGSYYFVISVYSELALYESLPTEDAVEDEDEKAP